MSSPICPFGYGARIKAGEFYKKAFAAEQVHLNPPDEKGRTMHLHVHINGSSVMMSDCYPEHGHPYVAPAGFNLMLPVATTWMAGGSARWMRGCTGSMAPQDMFWGGHMASCKDPYGVTWAFVGPKK